MTNQATTREIYHMLQARLISLTRSMIEKKLTLLIFLSAIAIYAWISIFKHLNYQSNAFDLAIFAQTSWLIAHVKDPYSIIRMIFEPADHFGPTY
jgi:uncharacterized membrane protein